MKQNITVVQLDELTAGQTVKLFTWGMTHKYLNDKEMFLPNIGQMIEFLDESRTGDKKLFPWWNSFFTWDYGGVDGYESEHKEFCDALWQAVKEKLEEE